MKFRPGIDEGQVVPAVPASDVEAPVVSDVPLGLQGLQDVLDERQRRLGLVAAVPVLIVPARSDRPRVAVMSGLDQACGEISDRTASANSRGVSCGTL